MWWPFRRPRRSNTQYAVYEGSGGILTILLPQRIAVDGFEATQEHYRSAIMQRQDMPDSLKYLLTQLFVRGAIIKCKITFGSKMELTLAKYTASGHEFQSGKRLEHFQTVFASIAGQNLNAAWQTPASGRGQQGGAGIDQDAFVAMVGGAVRGVANGLQLAAAIKILSGGNN